MFWLCCVIFHVTLIIMLRVSVLRSCGVLLCVVNTLSCQPNIYYRFLVSFTIVIRHEYTLTLSNMEIALWRLLAASIVGAMICEIPVFYKNFEFIDIF